MTSQWSIWFLLSPSQRNCFHCTFHEYPNECPAIIFQNQNSETMFHNFIINWEWHVNGLKLATVTKCWSFSSVSLFIQRLHCHGDMSMIRLINNVWDEETCGAWFVRDLHKKCNSNQTVYVSVCQTVTHLPSIEAWLAINGSRSMNISKTMLMAKIFNKTDQLVEIHF